jgi:hypothetical protein
MSVIGELTAKRIGRPPAWLPDNVHYETIMGSVAYGVSADTSDMDVYGFCIPPKDEVFGHLRGEIIGFGTPRPRFTQYQEHHLNDPDALAGRVRVHDVTIYNIVDYFQRRTSATLPVGRDATFVSVFNTLRQECRLSGGLLRHHAADVPQRR